MTATRGEIMRGLTMAMTLQNVTGAGGAQHPDIVRDGLIVYYDGRNNTGFGHKSSTGYWTDLSGNNNHGIIANGVWGSEELIFNGSSTWVNCGRQDYPAVTMEALFSAGSLPDRYQDMACNIQTGGYGLFIEGELPYVATHRSHVSDATYVHLYGPAISANEYYMMTGTADEHGQKLYMDGELYASMSDERTLDMTQDNTVFALGLNPIGDAPGSQTTTRFQGRIKAFRLYNRVLTPEEIQRNYRYDKARFGL